jgi:Zn finger protein HypA/HybF involved in hydrogenase expression
MKSEDKVGTSEILYVYRFIKEELLKINNDEKYVTDVLVRYLFDEVNSSRMETLWKCFGETIYENVRRNIKGTIQCEDCGKRVKGNGYTKMCKKCSLERTRVNKRKYKQQRRK